MKTSGYKGFTRYSHLITLAMSSFLGFWDPIWGVHDQWSSY